MALTGRFLGRRQLRERAPRDGGCEKAGRPCHEDHAGHEGREGREGPPCEDRQGQDGQGPGVHGHETEDPRRPHGVGHHEN
eukprot:12387849-Alexandrium_andersonii.AAC.1